MTTKPKIELRKLSHLKGLSEETPAYTAQIWVDGKHFCDVSNHGQGGGDMHHPPKGSTNSDFYPRLQALEALIKSTFEPVDCSDLYRDGQKHEMEQSLELLCHTMLGDIEIEKALKRDLSKKILFVKPGKPGIWQVKKAAGQVEQMIAVIKDTHKIEHTLNEMPFEAAFAVYKSAA